MSIHIIRIPLATALTTHKSPKSIIRITLFSSTIWGISVQIFLLIHPYNTHKILYLSSALTFPISFLVCWFFPFSIFAIENHTLVSLSIFNPYPSSAKPTHSLIYHYRHVIHTFLACTVHKYNLKTTPHLLHSKA